MSSARAGQRGSGPVPAELDGQPAPPAGGAAAARAGRRPAAAVRYAPVAAAAATMTVLGLCGLERDSSMGNDEVATRWAALLNLRQLAHLLRNVDAVHGLYYLLMHGWMAVGTSPAVIRVPSVISMAAAAAMLVIIGRRLAGSGWAGLFAGLIMALTPTISFYAQTARSYALVFACVLGSTLALLHAMKAEAAGLATGRIARQWLRYGALLTLAGYLNELSLLVLAAHAVTVLLARYGRRTVAHWAAASAAGAALVLPLVMISSREDGAVAWIPRPGRTDLKILLHDYFGPATVVAVLLAVCVIAAVLPHGGRRRRRPGGAVTEPGAKAGYAWWSSGGISLPSVAAPLLVLPAAVLMLESLVARPLYVDRYVLSGEAGAALLAGSGAYRIGRWLSDRRPDGGWLGNAAGRRALVWVPGVAVCLCSLLLQLAPQQHIRTPQSRLFDFGGPARYLAARAQRGDGVLFFTAFYRKDRLGYPREFRQVSDFALAVAPAQAGTFHGRDKPSGVTSSLMLGYRRIWVVGRPPPAMPSAGPYHAETMVLRRHFTLAGERRFRGIVVTLWLRR